MSDQPEMTQEEIDQYMFRVGRFYFVQLGDAIIYAMGCLYASQVVNVRTNTVQWQDGDVSFRARRPGFGVLIPYKGRTGKSPGSN